MWQSPVILFWPLLGNFPIVRELGVFNYMQTLIYGLRNPMVGVPEVLGLSYLIFLAFESKLAVASRWQILVARGLEIKAAIQTLIKID